ncbi:MAG: hypothetical protein ACJAU6_003003 [Alphaproteobacteria bacterium]|jgi:hypothetical protein
MDLMVVLFKSLLRAIDVHPDIDSDSDKAAGNKPETKAKNFPSVKM